ncbi:hypothetical protein [Legionella sp. W05-934-2]|uniref:hypothetical protein n=1 Tax=Legionella sp. W05-934-2 TaxID=1198649 RepID=UPI0034623EAC
MDDISQFRGYAGEVVRNFLKFSTFLTIIPLIIFWFVVYLIMYLMGNKLPGLIYLLINLLTVSFLLARFTIPACAGELDAGFFSPHIQKGDTGSFVLRYLIYMFAWMIPVYLLAKYVLKVHSVFSMFFFGPSSFGASSSFHGLLALVIVLAIVFGPTISCILAAITSSLEEVFSLEPIIWLWSDRRYDLGPYYSAAFGGLIVFYAKYIIPLSIINILLYKSSFEAGITFSTFISILPFLISPIIIGRLSGAFVSGEQSIADPIDTHASPLSPSPISPNSPNGNGNGAQPTSETESWAQLKDKFNELLPRLEKMSESELTEQVKMFNAFDSNNVHVQLALAHLYYHQKQSTKALNQAKIALKSSLHNGMGYESVALFQKFKDSKAKLDLDNQALISLGAFLTNQHYFTDAAWCYMIAIASAKSDNDKLEYQKKYIEMADKANRANESNLAYQLYQLFLKQCPDSTLADFVTDQANTIQVRLSDS